jgi:hypothetical protein
MSIISTNAQTWSNPLMLKNEWPLYSIGDPYVLKYNGLYFLYCSTRDSETGIKVWSSKDLVSWEYRGLCATVAISHGAYAPEVIQWVGSFYMYTSPAGNGHYILKSDSPTGPFETATNNLGHSIDGSVFKEDDGSLYFYHAGDDGIHAHTMSSPTRIGSDIVLGTTRMNGWTEGPCVIKRNGIYYMIYTGNHVISKGYRIDLSMSKTKPAAGFTPETDQNPVILNSEGTLVGLGHGSMFEGPDLDSYYITYHNLAGDYGVGPYRHLNFDRIAFNGDKLLVLGPTSTAQQAPVLPDFYDHFDSGSLSASWATKNGTWSVNENNFLMLESGSGLATAIDDQIPGTDYTAEFNISENSSNAQLTAGALFNYVDDKNYGTAIFNKEENTLEVKFYENGSWSEIHKATLPGVNNYAIFHSIRIEKNKNSLKFYADKMLKLSLAKTLQPGKIGFISFGNQARFGYIAFTNRVNGNAVFDIYQPIPGKIAAVHYTSGGQNSGYSDTTLGNDLATSYRSDDVEIGASSLGGFQAVLTSNEWLKYRTMVSKKTNYNIGIRYAATADNCKIKIWQGETDVTGIVEIPSTGSDSNFEGFTLMNIQLEAGQKELKIEVLSGTIVLYDFNVREFSEVTPRTEIFNSYSNAWNYTDGSWSIQDGAAKIIGPGKRTLGSGGWTDYSVTVDVKYLTDMNGGIIFRVNNPALGGAGNSAEQGTDFYQGYFVTITQSGCVLGKQNYNYTQLKKSNGSYQTGKWYKMGVTVSGNTIKVYVDDFTVPVIEYIDEKTILCGKAGLRAYKSTVLFDNFTISNGPFESTNSSEMQGSELDFKIYPNPVKDQLYISHSGSIKKAEIFSIQGSKIIEVPVDQYSCTINMQGNPTGTYLVKLTSRYHNIFTQQFILQ